MHSDRSLDYSCTYIQDDALVCEPGWQRTRKVVVWTSHARALVNIDFAGVYDMRCVGKTARCHARASLHATYSGKHKPRVWKRKVATTLHVQLGARQNYPMHSDIGRWRMHVHIYKTTPRCASVVGSALAHARVGIDLQVCVCVMKDCTLPCARACLHAR